LDECSRILYYLLSVIANKNNLEVYSYVIAVLVIEKRSSKELLRGRQGLLTNSIMNIEMNSPDKTGVAVTIPRNEMKKLSAPKKYFFPQITLIKK
jgi:hypothetical protein